MSDGHAIEPHGAKRDARVIARWCDACSDRTAHEAVRSPWRALRGPRHECVRCAGRRERRRRVDACAWLGGRTVTTTC